MPVPANCAVCAARAQDGTCHRHAPSPGSDEDMQRVFWPKVRDTDRCSQGDTEKAPVKCGSCTAWYQPGGLPLDPNYKQGLPEEWWQESGYCTIYSPSPTTDESHETFWRVTHASGGCLDGTSIDEEDSNDRLVLVAG